MRSEIVVAGENKETAGIEPSSVSMTIMSMGSVHHHHHHLHHQDESTINSCSQRTAVIQQPQQLLLQPNPFASPPPPPPAPVAQSSQHQDQHQQQQRGQFREPELNIEFDGTTVLCRVCGDKASGFHYGVHSCEGCKGFFRRSIQQKIQYRPCTKNQQCSILRINRNRCQYCRLKKCIAVGMSRDAVRFGRVPKREKAKILAAMQSVNARLAERNLPAEFSDEMQLMQSVVRAHMETCDFTREKVQLLMEEAHRQPNYTACPPTLACPLNPTPAPSNGQQQLLQDFSERFLPAIRDVVEFAKRLPGFALLAEDDKVTLLKPGVFEVLLVRLATMFDSQSNTMLCLNGQLLRRDALHNSSNARFLMDSMFEFAERLNSLQLNDAELGVFCAVVIVAADRPGLRNVELVERMQSKLRSVLENMLNQAQPEKAGLFVELLRKIPDLRTLNTLHSEKLLAFKMTEQQQQQQHYHHQQQQQPASPWTDDQYRDSYDEEGSAKSPMGSVSSSGAESMCSGGMGDSASSPMSDLPLLAAVAGSAVPMSSSSSQHHHQMNVQLHHHLHRRRGPSHSENGSSSMSSDGEETDSTAGRRSALRMVDSPPARGMMTTLITQLGSSSSASSSSSGGSVNGSNGNAAGGITVCPYGKMRKLDSPDDSGIESGVDRYEKLSTASRSTNTSLCSSPRSSLEDKVKDVDEMQSHPPTSNASASAAAAVGNNRPLANLGDDMPVLKRVLQAPPLFDTNSLMDEAYKPHKKFRALTLRKGGEDVPTRAPASPPTSTATSSSSSPAMSVLSAALSSPPSHHYSALCNALTSSPSSSSSSSSLTSTHSTLARSLMEGPKMMVNMSEQQRRADLIMANIMKGTTVSSPSPPPPSSVASSPPHSNGQQQRTVLTSGPLYVAASSSSSSSASNGGGWNYRRQPSPSHQQQHLASSPRPTSNGGEQQQQTTATADSQPLNLSLKSPSSSPARSSPPPSAPVTAATNPAHYFSALHA